MKTTTICVTIILLMVITMPVLADSNYNNDNYGMQGICTAVFLENDYNPVLVLWHAQTNTSYGFKITRVHSDEYHYFYNLLQKAVIVVNLGIILYDSNNDSVVDLMLFRSNVKWNTPEKLDPLVEGSDPEETIVINGFGFGDVLLCSCVPLILFFGFKKRS